MSTLHGASIIKSGWLHRETSVLRRWKKSWFVLYADGLLRYFDSPNSHTPEMAVVLKLQCTEVNSCRLDATPPEGRDSSALFSLVFLSHGTWNLCAENSDDMKAWTMAINDLRQGGPMRRGPPQSLPQAPYPAYPPAVYPSQTVMYNTAPGAMIVPGGMPPQTVVYTGDPLFSHLGIQHYPYGSTHCYTYGSGISSPFGTTMVTPGAVLSPPTVYAPYTTTRYL